MVKPILNATLIFISHFLPTFILSIRVAIIPLQKCIGITKSVASFIALFEELKFKWDKVLKNGTSKICGRQPLKNFK